MKLVLEIALLVFVGYLLINFGYVVLSLAMKYRIMAGFVIFVIVLLAIVLGWRP
jgi:hypothetical protein